MIPVNEVGSAKQSPEISITTPAGIFARAPAPLLLSSSPTSLQLKVSVPQSCLRGTDLSSLQYYVESDIENPGQLAPTSSLYASNCFTFSGLRPARPYHFRVALCGTSSRSPLSPIVSFVTKPAPPEPPISLCMAALDDDHSPLTFARVKWSPPPCDNGVAVNGYRVELALLSGGSGGGGSTNSGMGTHQETKRKRDYSLVEQTESCTCLLSNLQPGKSYAVRVLATNPLGASTPSDILTFTAGSTVPDAMDTPFLSKHPTDRQAAIAWTEPTTYGSAVIGYHVLLQPGNRSFLLGNVHSYVLNKLQPETEYSVRVAACSALGEGMMSPPLVFRTDERMAGVPVMGAVEKIIQEDGKVVLSWSAQASDDCPVEK